MITIIIAALITVVTTAWLIHPLMNKGGHKNAFMVMTVLPLCALALYLWQGKPDLPSAPAAFEREGPRAALRALARDELKLTQALSQDPGNEDLKTQLGEIFYARGLAIMAVEEDIPRARAYLDSALAVAPGNAPYLRQLRDDRGKMGDGGS